MSNPKVGDLVCVLNDGSYDPTTKKWITGFITEIREKTRTGKPIYRVYWEGIGLDYEWYYWEEIDPKNRDNDLDWVDLEK